jgi:hypothetical protein
VPFIQGFQFLFEEATVQVQSGYVNVIANAQYKGTGSTAKTAEAGS